MSGMKKRVDGVLMQICNVLKESGLDCSAHGVRGNLTAVKMYGCRGLIGIDCRLQTSQMQALNVDSPRAY